MAEETSSNLDEVKTPASNRATRKLAAKGTGYSGKTLDKVDKVIETELIPFDEKNSDFLVIECAERAGQLLVGH